MGANEKHEATYHGGEYVADSDTLKAIYVKHRAFNDYGNSFGKFWERKAVAEFDRAIAKIKAEAWDEELRLGVGGLPPHTTAILFKANPYN